MQRELHRAREALSNRYIVSDSVRWDGDRLRLKDMDEKHFDNWIECDPTTRSISHPNMVDKMGKRCFAATNNGMGGDVVRRADGFVGSLEYGKALCPKSGQAYHGFFIRSTTDPEEYTNYDGTIEVLSICEWVA